jgi:4,5-DOPA dioxygenase extradiol
MRAPVLFVSHGSPMIAIEDDPWGRALQEFGAREPRPRAAVVVSGHFEAPQPVRVTASERPETIHDFYGFPDALYRIRYGAPGDPALARRVADRLDAAGIAAALDPDRGLDHGAWVPLRFLYPDATVPVLEVSQPQAGSPERMLALGAALASLRDEGVAIVGTGGVVHNLRRIDPSADADGRVAGWAREFDAWFAERLAAMDVEAIADYRRRAPHAALAVPTPDHFHPVFAVLGAAAPGERAATIHEGFRYGTISMRSFVIGTAASSDAPRPS